MGYRMASPWALSSSMSSTLRITTGQAKFREVPPTLMAKSRARLLRGAEHTACRLGYRVYLTHSYR